MKVMRDAAKIHRVIDSCTLPIHTVITLRMIDNFHKLYGNVKLYKNYRIYDELWNKCWGKHDCLVQMETRYKEALLNETRTIS
jgi:hypothetical protein